MKLRIVAMLLALLMLVFVAVGCSNNTENGDATTTTTELNVPTEVTDDKTEETTEYVPTFVEANYGNAQFVVYQRNSGASSYPGMYIDSDSVTDTMSEAVFNRNLAVEEKYGVEIVTMEEDSPYKSIRTYVQSGDVPFDVILDRRSYMGSVAQEGYLYNFNELEHVDFTQPYWDSNCIEDYSVANRLFFMANDISVSNLAGARFFYFNKSLISQYGLQNPYDLIANNQWTLETFLEMVKAVSTDNGDGVWDGNDIYGLCSETGSGNGNIMHLMVGCGVKYVEKEADGTLTTNAYNEKTQDIMSKVAEVFIDTNYVITYAQAKAGADTSGYSNDYDYGRSLFATDHFLFIQGNMGISSQFKDMQSDYGVAPNPKYNAAQESYYHKMDKYSLIWAIPQCEMDYDRVGVIMEYWAYASSTTVMPAYYEITIKTKRVQEQTASDMIDLVKATIRYDVCEIYNSEVLDVLYNGYTSGRLASTWSSSKKLIAKKLTAIYDAISALD